MNANQGDWIRWWDGNCFRISLVEYVRFPDTPKSDTVYRTSDGEVLHGWVVEIRNQFGQPPVML